MMTVPFWSPFIVAMAVASQYLPLVPLWQIILLGLAMSVMAIAVSVLVFNRNAGWGTLSRSLRSLAPVAFPVFVAALIVVGATGATQMTTLQALILTLPIPCILAVVTVRSGNLSRALRQTASGIGGIGPETFILVSSITLGTVFEAALPDMGVLG